MSARNSSATLDDIAAMLSESAAQRLRQHCAGQRLYVSNRLSPQLVAALGAEDAAEFSRQFAANHVHVPTGRFERIAQRDEQLLRDARAGSNSNTLASRYGLTERHVRRIVARHRTD